MTTTNEAGTSVFSKDSIVQVPPSRLCLSPRFWWWPFHAWQDMTNAEMYPPEECVIDARWCPRCRSLEILSERLRHKVEYGTSVEGGVGEQSNERTCEQCRGRDRYERRANVRTKWGSKQHPEEGVEVGCEECGGEGTINERSD